MNTNRRSKTKRAFLLIIVVAILIAIIGGTYARYSSKIDTNANVNIAKWAIKFTDGTNELDSTHDVTFTTTSNANIVANKIAPSYSAVGNAQVELKDTEVSVDLKVDLSSANLSTLFPGVDASRISTSVVVKKGQTTISPDAEGWYAISLPSGAAFTAANGTIDVEITLTWTNSDTENQVTADTAIGVAGGSKTIPVTITARQHI